MDGWRKPKRKAVDPPGASSAPEPDAREPSDRRGGDAPATQTDALPADAPTHRLRAMGVLPEWRRQRVGEALIEAGCDAARANGSHFLWCDAREVALRFYEAQGFRFLSSTYEIPLIGPHRMMARPL